MKKLNLLVFALVGLFAFTSCEEANVGPTYDDNAVPPAITSSIDGESFTLTEENIDDVALELSWSKPGVGFRAEATYTVEMAAAGTDFAEPANLAQTTATSISMTVGELNNKMLTAGFSADVQADIDVRVKAKINDNVDDLYSDAVSFSVTPFFIDVDYPQIFVPGGYQSASGYTNDWSPADAPALTSVEDNGEYEGYVYMANTGNQFKFTPERNWNSDWGDTGADGTLEVQGSNIELADAGYYKMNVDVNNLTYSILNTDWGVIGSATPGGWDADTDMTYNATDKVWTIDIALVSGELKFRANDAWDLNYGDNEGDGRMERDGGNIAISSGGNYTITLDLGNVPYSYTIAQN